jgi:hypothetical protein
VLQAIPVIDPRRSLLKPRRLRDAVSSQPLFSRCGLLGACACASSHIRQLSHCNSQPVSVVQEALRQPRARKAEPPCDSGRQSACKRSHASTSGPAQRTQRSNIPLLAVGRRCPLQTAATLSIERELNAHEHMRFPARGTSVGRDEVHQAAQPSSARHGLVLDLVHQRAHLVGLKDAVAYLRPQIR